MTLRVSRVFLEPGEPEESLLPLTAARLGIEPSAINSWRILRKSLDARRHDLIRFEYSLVVNIKDQEAALLERLGGEGAVLYEPEEFQWPEPGAAPLRERPVVVGSGPAGLFAGYFLALSGYSPLILERGRAVKDRVADVRAFDGGGALNAESNYLFGEGGAGTFSDGKLTSRSGGADVEKILSLLAECHAKPSIVYEHRPHLGSNRLPLLVRTLRRKVEELGGEVRFSCRLEDLEVREGSVCAVGTSSGRMPAQVVVLAIGHSARDTYQMLLERGVPLAFKPFQFGVRIEQPQEQVNKARYGVCAPPEALGAADYSMRVKAGGRDLFTFCMCAGGYVMPSVSEPGHFCTNGMSESRHDSPFANSGLVMTIQAEDTGSSHPLAGVHFQQRIEHLAFLVGGRDYHAPIQWAKDFLAGRASSGKIPSSYELCSRGVAVSNLNLFLPPLVARVVERGLPAMDRVFSRRFLKEATLTGPESRGSSPVRITRDEDTRTCLGWDGLYPCGEGAGYAGGIVSAAVDGLRTARAIVARYAPPGS